MKTIIIITGLLIALSLIFMIAGYIKAFNNEENSYTGLVIAITSTTVFIIIFLIIFVVYSLRIITINKSRERNVFWNTQTRINTQRPSFIVQ